MTTEKEITFEEIEATCFSHIVGQVAVKRQLIQAVLAAIHGGNLLSGLFLAPAGTGKTALLKAYANALETFLGIRTMIVTPSEFRRTGDTWNDLLNLLDGGEYFLAIDEAHELYTSKTVQTAKVASFAMRALDGNYDGGGIKLSEELTVSFSRKRCAVMFATNFPGKLPEALGGQSGRAPRIELSLYSEDELKRILLKMLDSKKIRACEESLGIVARCGRGTARPLEHVCSKLETNLLASGVDKRTVNKTDILQALIDCQMYPLGYSNAEIEVLKSLSSPMTQQVVLARHSKLDLETWRKLVGYGMGLAHIGKTVGGFCLADKGRRYLDELSKAGFTV